MPEIGGEAGLLRVEACGVCGTDVRDRPRPELPSRVMGHEIVGVVEELGHAAGRRWGIGPGDRVLIEEYLPCGHCARCRSGDYRMCPQTDIRNAGALRYGAVGVDVPPALWGGFSQYLWLHPATVIHRVPEGTDWRHVPLAIPLSNGYEWIHRAGAVGPGECVVVIGPGQQGLACLVAAKVAGASAVVVAGLGRDAARFAVAGKLGADRCVDLEREDLQAAVAEVSGGAMASIVVDAAAGSESTVNAALRVLRDHGTLVLAARAAGAVATQMRLIREKCLTVRGVRGHGYEAVEWGLSLVAAGWEGCHALAGASFPLPEVDAAVDEIASGRSVHAVVNPWV